MNEAEQKAFLAEVKKMEKQCESKETQAASKLPPNFAQDLEHELAKQGVHDPNEWYRFVDKVVVC